MTEPIDTLQKYGNSFQTKCITTMVTDRGFLEQIVDILHPMYFESEANRWIVEKVVWYFNNYRSCPTIEVFKAEVDKLSNNDVLRVSVTEHLRNIYQQRSAIDLEYIKDEFLTFCKNQALKSAILKAADLVQTGKYEQIKVLVDKAMHAGAERNLGHNWNEELEVRINKMSRNTVETPWAVINQILDGGLGAGELGCWIAPSGIGKSWILSKLGAHSMKRGKRVAHYTFELSENYTGLRYDTIFTGIEPQKIKDHVDIVQKTMTDINGQLYIKYFPTRTVTCNAITAHIQRLMNVGLAPDIIIIDYADLMRSSEKSNAKHEELGYIYEEIRGMLGELRLPGWTASQSQRSALQDDVVEADKIAGSYGKIMVCDVVMSASRKLADKLSHTARVHAIKNRFGPDGMVYPAIMDLSRGKIEIYDENSPEGAAVMRQLQSGEGTMKALLAKKLDVPRP